MVLTILRRRIRLLGATFGRILDEQGVGIFQGIVYVFIGPVAGLYGLLVAGGTPQAVEDAMGSHFNALWLWLCIAISTCLVGKLVKWDAGAWLQLSGDLAAFVVLLVYIIATFESAWLGKALYAVFLCMAIWVCVLLLIIRDIRRIVLDQRRLRR